MAPHIKVVEKKRLFPSPETHGPGHHVFKLSVLDSYAGNYSPTGAVWFFEAGPNRHQLDGERLRRGFSALLDERYPQFGGRLRRVVREAAVADGASGAPAKQTFYNRHDIWWGGPTDPGVEFVLAECPERLDSFMPSVREQAQKTFWRADDLPMQDFFLPDTPMASGTAAPESDDEAGESEEHPCVVVQVTSMACGGVVIGFKMLHVLGDATTLGQIVKEWSQMNVELFGKLDEPASKQASNPKGIYDHSLIDRIANTVPASAESRDKILQKAYSLPFHRYDWYSNEEAPYALPAMEPPQPLKHDPEVTRLAASAKTPPWADWDLSAPTAFSIVQFSPDHIRKLRDRVMSHIQTDPQFQGLRAPSTLDIVLAHLWACINRARGFNDIGDLNPSKIDGNQVYVDMTIGLRPRLSPPLPDTFMGNPLAIVATGLPSTSACTTAQLPAMAFALRGSLEKVDPDSLAAHIYSVTQETTPQRLRQAFLGRRHLLVTSWIHSGASNADFGLGKPPVFVHPIMPLIDGCIELIEATSTDPLKEGAKWYERGLSINVYLEKVAMERLGSDPELHP